MYKGFNICIDKMTPNVTKDRKRKSNIKKEKAYLWIQ